MVNTKRGLKMKKRTQQRVVFTIGSLVALILTLYTVVVFSIANTTLRADAAATPESFFTFNSASGEITDYDIAGGTDVVIPSSIGGVAVVKIAPRECSYVDSGDGNYEYVCSGSFYKKGLTSVIIPEGIQVIGDAAFSENAIVGTLTIPDSVNQVGSGAFSYNQIEKVHIGSSVTELGSSVFANNFITELEGGQNLQDISGATFYGNNFTSLDSLPASVKVIRYAAFMNNDFVTLEIPDTVEYISNMAFSGPQLKEITVGSKDYIGPSVLTLEQGAFIRELNEYDYIDPGVEKVTINRVVKAIEGGAFQHQPITSLVINEGVEDIMSGAFADTTVSEVYFPNSLQYIGESPFERTTSLRTLKFGTDDYSGPTRTIIGEGAFESSGQPDDVSLDTVILNGSVKTVTQAAFRNSNIKTLTINEGVETIEQGAFSGILIENLRLPNSLRSLWGSPFSDIATLRTVEIGTSDYSGPALLDIEGATFETSSYESDTTFYDTFSDSSITLNGIVRTVGAGAFAKYRVAHMYAHPGLQEVAEGAFNGSYIRTAELPSTVTAVGDGAFADSSLREITIQGNPVMGEGVFAKTGLDINTLPEGGGIDEHYQNNAELVQVHSDNDAFSYGNEYFYSNYYETGEGAQHYIVSGTIVNPSSYTVTHKAKNGETLSPNRTFTSNLGYEDYRVANILDLTYPSSPSLRFDDYLQKGSVVSPEVLYFEGYTSPDRAEVSLKSGVNVINYIYSATADEEIDETEDQIAPLPLIPNTGILGTMVYKNPILVIVLTLVLLGTLLYTGIRLARR